MTELDRTNGYACPSDGEPCLANSELNRLRAELEHVKNLSVTDDLTGLFNKRQFENCLRQELERTDRTSQPTTLILLDIDFFKRINDQHGHPAGDQVLKVVGECIGRGLRKFDIPCRYGGEEFAILLPSTPLLTGIQVAERLRASLEKLNVRVDEQSIAITASLGVETYTPLSRISGHALVERADKQLYLAKSQGRNRVCFAQSTGTESQVSQEEKQALTKPNQ